MDNWLAGWTESCLGGRGALGLQKDHSRGSARFVTRKVSCGRPSSGLRRPVKNEGGGVHICDNNIGGSPGVRCRGVGWRRHCTASPATPAGPFRPKTCGRGGEAGRQPQISPEKSTLGKFGRTGSLDNFQYPPDNFPGGGTGIAPPPPKYGGPACGGKLISKMDKLTRKTPAAPVSFRKTPTQGGYLGEVGPLVGRRLTPNRLLSCKAFGGPVENPSKKTTLKPKH